jgi:hypothetical protein
MSFGVSFYLSPWVSFLRPSNLLGPVQAMCVASAMTLLLAYNIYLSTVWHR